MLSSLSKFISLILLIFIILFSNSYELLIVHGILTTILVLITKINIKKYINLLLKYKYLILILLLISLLNLNILVILYKLIMILIIIDCYKMSIKKYDFYSSIKNLFKSTFILNLFEKIKDKVVNTKRYIKYIICNNTKFNIKEYKSVISLFSKSKLMRLDNIEFSPLDLCFVDYSIIFLTLSFFLLTLFEEVIL